MLHHSYLIAAYPIQQTKKSRLEIARFDGIGFALGIEVKILFAHLQSKKIETNSPPERPNGMQPYIKIGEELGRKVKANDCYLKSAISKFKYYFII